MMCLDLSLGLEKSVAGFLILLVVSMILWFVGLDLMLDKQIHDHWLADFEARDDGFYLEHQLNPENNKFYLVVYTSADKRTNNLSAIQLHIAHEGGHTRKIKLTNRSSGSSGGSGAPYERINLFQDFAIEKEGLFILETTDFDKNSGVTVEAIKLHSKSSKTLHATLVIVGFVSLVISLAGAVITGSLYLARSLLNKYRYG